MFSELKSKLTFTKTFDGTNHMDKAKELLCDMMPVEFKLTHRSIEISSKRLVMSTLEYGVIQ